MMEQIERTRRYLGRIRNIYSGVPYVEDKGDYYLDDVLSFFLHCYHIRDWIGHLNRLGIELDDVDTFINRHKELQVCADLCNGTKHCRLTRSMRTGDQPHVAVRRFDSSGENGVLHTTRAKFQILSNGEFHDALDLAESCIWLWDGFVAEMQESANKGVDGNKG